MSVSKFTLEISKYIKFKTYFADMHICQGNLSSLPRLPLISLRIPIAKSTTSVIDYLYYDYTTAMKTTENHRSSIFIPHFKIE